MNDTYSKFDGATSKFSAYALLLDGKPVGRIVIKFGASATAYVQIWGAPMATARATGYGYDKATQAVMDAIGRFDRSEAPQDAEGALAWMRIQSVAQCWDGGTRYRAALENAGFILATVI